MLLESEARHAREAWSYSMNYSKAVHAELQVYRAQVQTHEIQIQTYDTRIGSLETLVVILKMPPKRTAATTTPMIDAQIKALISQGVAGTLAERGADKSRNGDAIHDLGTGGTEGVVGLTQWFEKMESIFHISNCRVTCQVKFATCTLQGNALTWGEIKKLEIELWNLKVKGTDVLSYNQRFQELALMCGEMFPEESDKVEKYVGGMPDMIQGSVMASKPKKMQDANEFTTELMDQKIRTIAKQKAEKKKSLMTLQGTTRTNSIHSKGTGLYYRARGEEIVRRM
ncbi:hypothetical protein Tco_1578741 [Tanacetum coccineum]